MGEIEAKEYKLIVNAQEKPWRDDQISYEQVVKLAYAAVPANNDTIYTVTYSAGPKANPEGSLVKGKKVQVKNRMIFNVTPTTKA